MNGDSNKDIKEYVVIISLLSNVLFFDLYHSKLKINFFLLFQILFQIREAKNYTFTSKTRDCYKCVIFVARLFSCYKHSGKKKLINERLMSKAKACLDILEAHLPENATPKKSAKNTQDASSCSKNSAPASAACTADIAVEPTNTTTESGRKKRGRPPKNAKSPPAETPLVASSTTKKKRKTEKSTPVPEPQPVASSTKKKKNEKDEVSVASSTKRKKKSENDEDSVAQSTGSSRPRRVSKVVRQSLAGPSGPTLQQLISRFEVQYEQMGESYREMGNILSQMKSAVASGRDRTEEEIRMDVFDEVQKTLADTFKKRK